LDDASRYIFRVCATLPKKQITGYSDSVGIWTIPNTAITLSGSGMNGSRIDLSWNDQSNHEKGQRLERSGDGKSFISLATLAKNAEVYSDTTVSAGSHYWYRVITLGGGGKESAASNVANVTPLATPKHFSATPFSNSRIDLKWDKVNGASTYQIMRGDGKSFNPLTS